MHYYFPENRNEIYVAVQTVEGDLKLSENINHLLENASKQEESNGWTGQASAASPVNTTVRLTLIHCASLPASYPSWGENMTFCIGDIPQQISPCGVQGILVKTSMDSTP